jgi:hypothetical protein
VTVGLRPEEFGYVRAALREVFLEIFSEEPGYDEGSGDAWFGPLTNREQAVEAARRLVEVDRRLRDPDVEVAFGVMTS